MHCPIVYKLIKYLTVKQELLRTMLNKSPHCANIMEIVLIAAHVRQYVIHYYLFATRFMCYLPPNILSLCCVSIRLTFFYML